MSYSFTRTLGQHREILTVEETIARRVNRHICARCGSNSDNGDCGHNCRSLSVSA